MRGFVLSQAGTATDESAGSNAAGITGLTGLRSLGVLPRLHRPSEAAEVLDVDGCLPQESSMPVYMVIEITRVHDADTYGEYMEKIPPVVARYGGRYVVRGGPVHTLAGGWQPARVIILEFASFEAMGTFATSPEYRALAPLRESATETRAIALEGPGA